ncbi:MAG: hypothetical protein A2Z31_03980 [candidate division NC10 bacterium RBG_16_65_8]|nr:MAG: hypothetical protein A2Z31_03980 [candidate division NC10 bacterium RBG_16_65_8]
MESAENDAVRTPELRVKWFHLEDLVALVFFWALAIVVFLQFFTRYALNNSLAWTEEIARYLLIGTAFAGAGMAARKNSHIFVAWFYQFGPVRLAYVVRGLVYLASALIYAVAAWVSYRIVGLVQERMVSIDLPFWLIYAVACVGFATMAIRTLQLAWAHWSRPRDLSLPHDGRHIS